MGYTTATTITQGGGSGAGTIGLPGVAASFDPRHVSDNDGGAANDMIGCRVVVPTTGTLHDLTIYISTSAGNIDVGIYSTAATRARLYSTGSIACPAGGGWRNVGDPALAVTAGDQYDFCVAQSAGATFAIQALHELRRRNVARCVHPWASRSCDSQLHEGNVFSAAGNIYGGERHSLRNHPVHHGEGRMIAAHTSARAARQITRYQPRRSMIRRVPLRFRYLVRRTPVARPSCRTRAVVRRSHAPPGADDPHLARSWPV